MVSELQTRIRNGPATEITFVHISTETYSIRFLTEKRKIAGDILIITHLPCKTPIRQLLLAINTAINPIERI